PNVKSAKNMLDKRPPEVFDILDEITKDHPVILNRAPTLHKLSIQAFYPILIEGSAIRIHPAVCSGFNADFDGDQMAVHVPLSRKAIDEAKNLMLPQHNLLRPADGSPITTPSSKEMALGVYYLTSIDPNIKESEITFSDSEEALLAYQVGKIALRQNITVRIKGNLLATSIGRILFNEVLPTGFDFVNEAVTSTKIKEVFTKAYSSLDKEAVMRMVDAIKDLGFYGGTISGLSYGIFDSKILPDKEEYLRRADKQVSEHEKNFTQGLITSEEKKRLSQQVWIEATEELADKTWDLLEDTNPIKVISNAKVGRVSRDQVKQLAAIQGLVVDPLGKIVELPIKANFKEGLSVFEYVTSSRGARKGLTDTALKTADAGYLTRRLVDVAHDVIVRTDDCGTKEGYLLKRGSRSRSFALKVYGRFAAASRYGICTKCYGWDLSNKEVVGLGTPVGVIAAQSIGEPGTQLTLRTKHSGGVVGIDVTQGLPRVEELIEARTPKIMAPLAEISGKVRIGDSEEGWRLVITSAKTKPKEEREYIIPKTVKLAVADKDILEAGTPLAEGSLDIREILSIKGLRAAQEYLVNEIQRVYESQGIPIHDKHFEVIVRKMSDEVRVITSGDTPLLPGELVEKATFEEENEKVLAAGGEPASAQQVILGITRRALFTESWLSAASFQMTTDVLTTAAILGKEDKLYGLKENVIIGRLIPVTPDRARLNIGGKIPESGSDQLSQI
ncbi:MAG: DNA-directed RNA polymerase subunit beta', partial [Candidatus Woesebacteria bacterium GW2011_GWA1_39_12]